MNTIHYMILGAKSPLGRTYIQSLADKGVDAKEVTAIENKPSSMSYGENDVIPIFGTEAYKHHEKRKKVLVVLADTKQDYIDIADTHLDENLNVLDLTGRFIDDPDAVLAPNTGKLVVQASAASRALHAIISRLDPKPESLIASVMLPASMFGKDGMDELFQQVRQFLVTDDLDAQVFPKKIAFNLIPYAGDVGDDGHSTEEHRMSTELQKLLPGVAHFSVSAAIVPVFIGLSMQVVLRFAEGQAPSAKDAGQLLRQSKTIRIIDPASDLVAASPAEITGEDALYISRLHNPVHMKDALFMWVMLDNTIY